MQNHSIIKSSNHTGNLESVTHQQKLQKESVVVSHPNVGGVLDDDPNIKDNEEIEGGRCALPRLVGNVFEGQEVGIVEHHLIGRTRRGRGRWKI